MVDQFKSPNFARVAGFGIVVDNEILLPATLKFEQVADL